MYFITLNANSIRLCYFLEYILPHGNASFYFIGCFCKFIKCPKQYCILHFPKVILISFLANTTRVILKKEDTHFLILTRQVTHFRFYCNGFYMQCNWGNHCNIVFQNVTLGRHSYTMRKINDMYIRILYIF